MRARYDEIGATGTIADIPPWELPDGAWSDSLNIRYRDGAAEVFSGQTAVFSTPPGNPYRLLPVTRDGSFYWVYPDISSIYATDSVTHANISPLTAAISASYSATDSLLWNGGAFNGFMTLNNARQIPLTWLPGLGTPCVQMNVSGAWPTDLRADVLRSYRNYLIALRCTEGGTYNGRLMRWSNAATPGSLPTSWDYTDVTTDSGRLDFGQTQDRLIDCLPMRDINVVYKESYVWAMQWVGGNANPFIFRQVFSQVGMMAEWCVAAFEGKHVVLTTDDVVVHDLNAADSVINKRMRRWLFSQINPSAINHCMVVPNYSEREMWICYPETGHTYANMALVWNWTHNTMAVRELGVDTPHIAWGIVEQGQSTTFDNASGTFDEITGPYDDQEFNPAASSLLMANPATPSFIQIDTGSTFTGSTINARLTREVLPIDKDVQQFKRIKRIYPRIIGEAGAVTLIYLGRQNTLMEPITWSAPKTFAVGTDRFINCDLRTTIASIRFETTAQLRFTGYDIEFDPAGQY